MRGRRGAMRWAKVAAVGLAATIMSGTLASTDVFYADPEFPVPDGYYRRCLWDVEKAAMYAATPDAPPVCETVSFTRKPDGYEVLRILGPEHDLTVAASYRDEWRIFATPEDDGEGQYVVFRKYVGEPGHWSIERLSAPGPQDYLFLMSDDRCHRMNGAARQYMQDKGFITRIDRTRGENRDLCFVREDAASLNEIRKAGDAWHGQHRFAWVFFQRKPRR